MASRANWLPPSLRRRAKRIGVVAARAARRPFPRLVRHFLDRMVSATGAGPLLGILAAPGAFQAFLLLDKYSAFLRWMRGTLNQDLLVVSVPDKYLFLAVAMTVTGIVTVLKWDRVLPDAQDYLNLAPLPLRARTVLLANASAIAIAVLILAIDVNAVSSVFFPFFVTVSQYGATLADYLSFAAIHAFTMTLACVFMFCTVFAVLGIVSALLPRDLFRAWSSWLRGLMLVGLITMWFSPHLLPPLWFTQLYQMLQHRGTAGATALWASAIAAASMVATYALSYRRRFAAVLEGGGKPRDQRILTAVLWLLDRFAPRPGFHRAAFLFTVRAMLRNEAHRLCIAVALGLGWLQSEWGAAYLLLVGLRFAFDLPAGIGANWIFRASLDPRATESAAVGRRAMLAFLAIAVLAPGLVAAWWSGGVTFALLRTAAVLTLSLATVEILLNGYRRIPLTCPLPGFRDHLLMLCLLLLLGFVAFTRIGVWVEAEPARVAGAIVALAAAWWWNRSRLRQAAEDGELAIGITFDTDDTAVVERLFAGPHDA